MAYTRPSGDGWRWSPPGPNRGTTTTKLTTAPGARTKATSAQNNIPKSMATRKRRANVKMKQTRGLG